MQENHLDVAVNTAFNFLRKTNRMLIVNDKDDLFFHRFYDKYKVCHIALVGSDFDSVPFVAGHSVTNIGKYIKSVYEDGCLNSAVDVLYVDLSRNLDYFDYFDEVIDDNTITIIRLRNPVITEAFPQFIKNNYEVTNCLKFGDWNSEHKYNSEYFLVFY